MSRSCGTCVKLLLYECRKLVIKTLLRGIVPLWRASSRFQGSEGDGAPPSVISNRRIYSAVKRIPAVVRLVDC